MVCCLLVSLQANCIQLVTSVAESYGDCFLRLICYPSISFRRHFEISVWRKQLISKTKMWRNSWLGFLCFLIFEKKWSRNVLFCDALNTRVLDHKIHIFWFQANRICILRLTQLYDNQFLTNKAINVTVNGKKKRSYINIIFNIYFVDVEWIKHGV